YGSILSYLANLNINQKDIQNLINEIKKIKAFSSPLNIEEDIVKYDFFGQKIKKVINNIEKNKEALLDIFKDLNINIVDMKFERNSINDLVNIFLVKNGDFSEFTIPFNQESSGTKKIIQILSILLDYMHDDSILFIDELDSQLHTKLLGYIIEMFYSKFNKKSQIVFTSHDMGTLSTTYFRKDQIYFAALNELNFTDLVCLNEFGSSIRESSSFSKIYLDGKIGYDPYIRKCAKIWK
ncbi:MAG: ATP-binding protein, partial [Ureaplasma sp.]|nr:ATP-binding protein [Ureaplasma sp.]